ncbi:MAG: bifunctional riboflavin kinase/FAD synthetase [Acidimicrobiales bacterium]
MRVVSEPSEFPPPSEGCAVTIGVYDGLHRGHLSVIARTKAEAARHGAAAAVVTFDPHPASVVRPESAPKLLTTLDQKLELLAAAGIDLTYVVRFDAERAKESAEDFVRDVLVGALRARTVVVGRDFHFGRGRGGSLTLLEQEGKRFGFEALGVDLLPVDGATPVSSTAIRRAVAEGDVARAAEMLGRPHEVRGLVHDGDKRGRTIGFPTANVAVPQAICMPADGIYAGLYVRPDGSVHKTAMSLGRRPTFYEAQAQSLLECFLLDFSGDLYGEPARVRFVERLRGEQKFDSVEALVEQMQRDVDRARLILR